MRRLAAQVGDQLSSRSNISSRVRHLNYAGVPVSTRSWDAEISLWAPASFLPLFELTSELKIVALG